MKACDYCGEEIVTEPYLRKGRQYCSRTCAEEDEFKPGSEDDALDEEEALPDEERDPY